METPIRELYNNKEIYIYFETFGEGAYVLCSYNDNGTKKFKLNKDQL